MVASGVAAASSTVRPSRCSILPSLPSPLATRRCASTFAGAVIKTLLDEDAVLASARRGAISDRGARRLFDRLVALGAVRELTGRATFRLYGL